MTRGDFGWDYPPGVTGNEPEIAGEDELVFVDCMGEEISVGDLVLCGVETDEPEAYGIVLEFDDPEGDVDDDGRSREVPGRCKIEFYGGTIEHISGHTQQGGPYTWNCFFDDLTLVKSTKEEST